MFSKIRSFIRRKISAKHKFDLQYENRKWDGLKGIAELGRYSVIVGYVKYFYPSARILDLGCGEGVLLQKFAPSDYARYLGVDFSDVAIKNANNLDIRNAEFVVGDLNKLQIDGTFDVIIYNESLYYLSDPQGAISRLLGNLTKDGIFIISMVDQDGKERTALWQQIGEILDLVEKTKVANKAGHIWTVNAYKMKTAQ